MGNYDDISEVPWYLKKYVRKIRRRKLVEIINSRYTFVRNIKFKGKSTVILRRNYENISAKGE